MMKDGTMNRRSLNIASRFGMITLLLVSAPGLPAEDGSESAIPEGRLKAWLSAFNTGETNVMREFIRKAFISPGGYPIDGFVSYLGKTYLETGALELRKVTGGSASSVTALCRGKATGLWMELQLSLEASPPDYQPKSPNLIAGVGLNWAECPPELLEPRNLSDGEISAELTALLSHFAAKDLFSGAVLVARNDRLVGEWVYGSASRAWGVTNRLGTRFHLASISKMFTAVAIAELVEQGRLSYTNTISSILCDYPNKQFASKATVHELLSHTSGLEDTVEWMDSALRSPKYRTIGDFLQTFAALPVRSEPGTEFNYSNKGYIILGAIMEKVTGQDYYSFVRENIFKRAGMNNTDFFELDSSTPNLAEGYADGPNGTRINNVYLLGVKGMPASGAYSTLEDMLRFSSALRSGKLLKQSTVEHMWTGVNVPGHDDGTYGYGCAIDSYNGERIIGHGGGWSGITDEFEMLPDLGATIVILSNYDIEPMAIANKCRELLTQSTTNTVPVPPRFAISAEISPASPRIGQAITITVSVTNSGGLARNSLVDIEVNDSNHTKVYQHFTEGQRFASKAERSYTAMWTPEKAGTYFLDLGVFGPGWSPKFAFVQSAKSFKAQ
jgi:CubicO group peptidase (beta-lactamase class C family)